MNKQHQFWTLIRFQISGQTIVFFIVWPLAFAMMSWIYLHNTPSNLSHDLGWLLFGNFWLLVPFIATSLLAPELSFVRASLLAGWSGTEFLLTRATDRHIVLRVRSALFYGLILLIPCILFLGTLKTPELQLKVSDARIYPLILNQIPNCIPMPIDKVSPKSLEKSTAKKECSQNFSKEIRILNGRVMIGSWRIWAFLCIGLATQLFLFLICSLRYQKFLFWGICALMIFFPEGLLMATNDTVMQFSWINSKELLFITFAAHQPLCWLITIPALILGQLWCEKRFARMEQ